MPPAMPAPLILLTRPRLASEAVARRLVKGGVAPDRVVIAPLMETVATGVDWTIDGVRGFVFTSAEAVRHATTMHELRWRPAYCVGDRTAEAAAAAGMEAISAGGTVDDLVALIAKRRPAPPLLYLRGEETRGEAAQRLTRAGTPTREAAIYRQQARPLDPSIRSRLSGTRAIVAPAYSPLSAERLAAELREIPARVHLVAISAATADAWPGPAPSRISIADRPDGAAMDRAILRALRVEARQASS
jgi:uroporphyrinogen-III synthase